MKLSGTVIANRSTDKRRALDFYPTPPDVTAALMEFLHERDIFWPLVWEPAAGNGAMAKVMREYGKEVVESDIANPDKPYDFLKMRWRSKRQLDAIVTNPPFALSEQFIRHALTQTPNVALLLKSQYWHSKRRLALFRETRPAYVLPLTWRPDFGGGGAPTMEVYWTVWLETTDPHTRYIPLERPKG